MTDGTGGRRRLRRMRWPGTRMLAIAIGITLLTAACSGSPSASSGGSSAAPGPASSSAGGSSGSSSSGSPATQQKMLAYTTCMRSHGVPMPDPPALAGKPPSKPTAKAAPVNGPNPGSPQWQAAQQACRSLLPPNVKGGPGPGGSAGG
jgi:hypothetical protein